MRRSTFSVALASVVLFGAGCEPPGLTLQQRSVAEQAVRNLIIDFTTAMNNEALEELEKLYVNSDDLSVLWIEGNTARGFEEFHEMTQDFYGRTRFLNFSVQSPQVDVLTENVAVVTFRHSVDVIWFDTRRDLFAGHGTLVLTKDPVDERWRIHRQHVSVNPLR
jgi:ketosteroid isomerase-like protein